MTGSQGSTTGSGRLARLALSLALAASCLAVDAVPGIGPSDAVAQERSRTIMDMLFGGPPKRRYIDPPPRRVQRKKVRQQRQKPARRSTTAARRKPAAAAAGASAAAAAAVMPEKTATAKTVLVVGDFLAGSLAGGLERAVEANVEVKVVGQSDGSSGFVRDDHYDWLARIGPLIDETKPAVLVAMIGSNDRQAIRAGGQSHAPRSEGWVAEYERRVEAFAKAAKDKNVPLVWVGMPAFKFDRMSEDMAYLNEIYRKAATTTGGGEFVDVWEGFVDANGAFAYSGPDIAGQPARLRNSDGITMTPEGAEKLAFFAEKPILRILGTTADGSATIALAPEEMSSLKLPPIANAANATSAPLVSLSDPSLDGGDALLGASAATSASQQPSPREKLVVSGVPAPAPSGRADASFGWTAKTSAVAPPKPAEEVLFRGSVDLTKVREPEPRQPPKPMPTLADAIVEDWIAEQDRQRAAAQTAAKLPAAPVAPASSPATRAAPDAGAAAAPVSASPFPADQAPR